MGLGALGWRVEGQDADISQLNSYSLGNGDGGAHTSWDGVFSCESGPGWNGVLGSALILAGSVGLGVFGGRSKTLALVS
jgi:hypothetical protein